MKRLLPLLVGTLPVLVLFDVLAVRMGTTLPAAWHLALFAALIVAAMLAARPHGPLARWLAPATFALAGVLLYWLPFGAHKQVWRAAWEVEPGMARGQVNELLEPRFHLDPAPWPHEAWPNRDFWIGECGGLQKLSLYYDANDQVEQVDRFFEGPDQLWGRGGAVVAN